MFYPMIFFSKYEFFNAKNEFFNAVLGSKNEFFNVKAVFYEFCIVNLVFLYLCSRKHIKNLLPNIIL